MKFIAIITLALSAVASAELTRVVRRQVDVSQPAMTDAQGNVISFDTAGVYNAASAEGL